MKSVSQKLQNVEIRNDDFSKVINNGLIYADPPYLMSSRLSKSKMYNHEMYYDNHDGLLNILLEKQCIISHYSCELYNEKLKGLIKFKIPVHDRTSRTAGQVATECVWINQ